MAAQTLVSGFLDLEDLISNDVCYFVIEENNSSKVHWDLAGYLVVAEEPILGINFGVWKSKTKQQILDLWDERINHKTGILLNCSRKITIEEFKYH